MKKTAVIIRGIDTAAMNGASARISPQKAETLYSDLIVNINLENTAKKMISIRNRNISSGFPKKTENIAAGSEK